MELNKCKICWHVSAVAFDWYQAVACSNIGYLCSNTLIEDLECGIPSFLLSCLGLQAESMCIRVNIFLQCLYTRAQKST